MGGVDLPEMIVVLIIALVIFGPKKLPQLGESMGKAISSFKKGMHEGTKEASATNEREAKAVEKKPEA